MPSDNPGTLSSKQKDLLYSYVNHYDTELVVQTIPVNIITKKIHQKINFIIYQTNNEADSNQQDCFDRIISCFYKFVVDFIINSRSTAVCSQIWINSSG